MVCAGPLRLSWPAGAPSSDEGLLAQAYPLLLQQRSYSDPIPVESEVLKLKPVEYRLKQNRETLIEPETGKDIPTRGDEPGAGCVALSLSVMKCPGPKAHSHMAEWG